MVDKHDIHKVSFWHDGPTETLKDPKGHLYDKDDHYKLKIKRGEFDDFSMPADARDWCVTVTDMNNEHFHGEITSYNDRGLYRTYKWPQRSAVIGLSP